METVQRIIRARDYAEREGAQTVLERIQNLVKKVNQQGGAKIRLNNGEAVGFAVMAEIEFGQWMAKCECGGAEMVDPDEPIFFCFGCGNRGNGGSLRPVIFPEPNTREAIEQLVLERPVDDQRGLDDLDRAFQAKPLIWVEVAQADGTNQRKPLSRSWTANESLEDLQKQNEPVRAWRGMQKAEGE